MEETREFFWMLSEKPRMTAAWTATSKSRSKPEAKDRVSRRPAVVAHLELRYFPDVDGREAGFFVVEKRRPLMLVEAKWGDQDVAPGLRHLEQRFASADAWQVSATGTNDYAWRDGVRVAPAFAVLRALV